MTTDTLHDAVAALQRVENLAFILAEHLRTNRLHIPETLARSIHAEALTARLDFEEREKQ